MRLNFIFDFFYTQRVVKIHAPSVFLLLICRIFCMTTSSLACWNRLLFGFSSDIWFEQINP